MSPKQERALRVAKRVGSVPVLGKVVAKGAGKLVGEAARRKVSEECLIAARKRPELRGRAEEFCKEVSGAAKGIAQEATEKSMRTKYGRPVIVGGGVHRSEKEALVDVCSDLESGSMPLADLIELARLLKIKNPERFHSKRSLCAETHRRLLSGIKKNISC